MRIKPVILKVTSNVPYDLVKLREAARGKISIRDVIPELRDVDPYDFTDEVWDSNLTVDEKLNLMFQLYEETPSYAVLVAIRVNRGSENDSAYTNYMLAKYKKYLSGRDKNLTQPARYDLWCGMFEGDLREQSEVWNFLLKEPCNDQLIENLLEISGPISYSLKRKLYDRLLPDRKWHLSIARSIYFSIIDAYGDIEWTDAKKVFRKLAISEKLDSKNAKIIRFLRSKNSTKKKLIHARFPQSY